jgi:RNA polymerase sigma-54 factor
MAIEQTTRQMIQQRLSIKAQQKLKILAMPLTDLLDDLQQAVLDNPFLKVKVPSLSGITSRYPIDWLADQNATHQSLEDYLLTQVGLTMRDLPLKTLVQYLIYHLDNNGYLTITLAAAAKACGVNQVMITDALTLLQQLEPAGVGGRSLQEVLRLQAQRDDTAPVGTEEILDHHLPALAENKNGLIQRATGLTASQVQAVLDYIRTLSPAPGAQFTADTPTAFAFPEVQVAADHGTVRVGLLKDTQIQLSFNTQYMAELSRYGEHDAQLQNYLTVQQKAYRTLLTAYTERQVTLLRVTQAIVARQHAFFVDPEQPLVPLLVKEVAEQLKLSPSTISRTINGKYLEFNRHIYELRHFFTYRSAVGYSQDALLSAVQTLIEAEDKQHPLTDNAIVAALQQKHIKLSRRTVVKYRDKLNIPAANKRREF